MIPAIFNAATQKIAETAGPTPNMRSTLAGWVRDLGLTRVDKSIVDFQTVETEVELPGRGIWQPLMPSQLAIKPEGERAWRWFMIHATTDLRLTTDDVIKRARAPYRVMADMGWDDNGYRLYHVVNDYDASADPAAG